MNVHDRPTCRIIAGPNGAGKTTFALKYLPEAGCQNFVNADLIAAGVSPLAPERERMSAGLLFLTELQRHIQARHDLGFETTLAGRGFYASLVHRTVCSLNSGDTPEIVFTQQGEHREVIQPGMMRLLQSWRRS